MFINLSTWPAAVGLLITLASATPTKFTKKSQYLEYRPSIPLSKRQAQGYTRGNVGEYGNGDLPPCIMDPSFANGPSQFKDGDGFSMDSGCDNKKSGSAHCWTDTFVVYYEFEHTNWLSTGAQIDCATSNSCSQENVNTNKTCTENKITTEGSIKGTIETKMPQWFEGWVPSFTFLSVGSTNNLETEKICITSSSNGNCQWNDKLCHGIWTAQRNRRVCLQNTLLIPYFMGLSATNMRIIAFGNEHAKHATTRGWIVYSGHAGFQYLSAGQHGDWVCGDLWRDYLS